MMVSDEIDRLELKCYFKKGGKIFTRWRNVSNESYSLW